MSQVKESLGNKFIIIQYCIRAI